MITRGTTAGLDRKYQHGRVAHSKGQYANGEAHTNGIESFWAPIKRAHKGVYHQMSRKHMHRYAAEFAGRHNLRGLDTIDQMKRLVLGMERKLLTWRLLTGESEP